MHNDSPTQRSFDTFAQLYNKYVAPDANIDQITTLLSSGTNLDQLEDLLLELGSTILETRQDVETEYLNALEKLQNVKTQWNKALENVEQKPSTVATQKLEKIGKEKSTTGKAVTKGFVNFQDIERDVSDFERACMTLPESNPDHDKSQYLTDTFDDAHGITSERVIGQAVLGYLDKQYPYVSQNRKNLPNFGTTESGYGLG